MSLASDIRAYILQDSTISGLLGGNLYQNRAEQNASMPYAVYELDPVTSPNLTLTGPTGPYQSQIAISVVSKDFQQADSIAGLIRNRLNNFSGVIGSFNVQWINFNSLASDYNVDLDATVSTVILTIYTD